jgi:hypothetical protein
LTLAVLAVLAVGLCGLLLVTLAGTADASVPDGEYAHNGTDNEGPRMTNGTTVNETAIAVTIADNHDVNESSIRPSDFLLERARVKNVSVTENGSNATAVLRLTRRVDVDDLTVALQGGAGIVDTNGNRINTDGIVVVDNMDGVPPALVDFSVTNATGGPATISLETSEQLGTLNVSVTGAASDHLDISGFDANGTVYERSYQPPEDGTVVIALENVTDVAGNTRETSTSEEILVDLTPPDPNAAIDLANSANLSITFDGSQSSDINGIETYTWAFGDGTTRTGQRVTHDFVPGNYSVTLQVSDSYGNVGTDVLTLNLSTGSGDVADINESELRDRLGTGLRVDVQRPTESVTSDAVVAVENARTQEAVAIGRVNGSGTPLAGHDGVTLEGIAVTLATNRSFDLGLSMAGAGSVADAASQTGLGPLAGFTVVNTVPDDDVANATVRFSVAQSRLEDLHASASAVTLYRQHDGGWQPLDTTAVNATNGTQLFRATSPGFSRFAVLAEGAATASVTAASVTPPEVRPDEEFTVRGTVANPRSESTTFTAGLAVDDSVVTTETVSVEAGTESQVTFNWSLSSAGSYNLTVNDTSAGQVTVAAATDDESDTDDPSGDGQFVVRNASVAVDQVNTSQIFNVSATVENTGSGSTGFTAGLEANGSVVFTTATDRPIPPGESRQIQVRYLFQDPGVYNLSVNGTGAGTLQVGDVGNASNAEGSGGGGGIVGTILGLVPMGIVQPLVLFVLTPLAVIFAILKGLAIYLGY